MADQDLELRSRFREMDASMESELKQEFMNFVVSSKNVVEDSDSGLSDVLSSILSTERCLRRISSIIDDQDKPQSFFKADEPQQGDLYLLLSGANRLRNLGFDIEAKFSRYAEDATKEKRNLQIRIEGLIEENTEISNLLRIALAEKEAAEKASKGSGEQKRTSILEIAEWGLQKAGLGFMVGGPVEESPSEHLTSCISCTSSDSEIGTVVRNLRREITDLRCSLEERRLENEHLKSMIEKLMAESADRLTKMKILEERESTLVKKVEELELKLEEAESELVRRGEEYNLEVETRKITIRECQTAMADLGDDLKRTKAELDATRNRLKTKEKLAETAIAAHAAIETSLRLADRRSVRLRGAIEELTRQLEEEAERGRRAQSGVPGRVRHICWPWGVLRVNSS